MKKFLLTEDNDPLRHSDTSPLLRGGWVGDNIEELKLLEQKINALRGQRGELERKLGRIEGILESRENKVKISGRCPLCGSVINENAEQLEKKHNEEKELADLKISQGKCLARG